MGIKSTSFDSKVGKLLVIDMLLCCLLIGTFSVVGSVVISVVMSATSVF